MRGTLWLEPLNIVAKPTPINISSPISNWVSMCAVSARVMRLITATDRPFIGFERRRLLAEQIIIEHLARNRRRRARTEPGVLDENGKRQLRLVGRGVSDKERMVAVALGHPALDIFLA